MPGSPLCVYPSSAVWAEGFTTSNCFCITLVSEGCKINLCRFWHLHVRKNNFSRKIHDNCSLVFPQKWENNVMLLINFRRIHSSFYLIDGGSVSQTRLSYNHECRQNFSMVFTALNFLLTKFGTHIQSRLT